MPNVNDIMAVAEALEKSSIAVVQDRCAVVRNRNATCRRCIEACASNAIEVSNNELILNVLACVGCGACTAVCPNEALVSLAPVDSDLADSALSSLAKNGETACIACARAASKRIGDPERYAEVPCLARVDVSMVLGLAWQGVQEVLLVDGDCTTCKYREHVVQFDATLECVNALFQAFDSQKTASRCTGFPEWMHVEDIQNAFGTTRRGFFSDAVGAAKETAMTAAKTKVEQEFGQAMKTPEIGERLRVNESGTLPLLRMARHETTINALDALGQPVVSSIDTHLFATVSIDTSRCNSCGMCSMFCPTGALRRDEPKKAGDPLHYLEFLACDCVNCGACADVCWKGALTLSTNVPIEQLFDFEPITFKLATAKKTKRLFD